MNIIFIENFEIYKRFTNVKTIGGIETNTNDVIKELRKEDIISGRLAIKTNLDGFGMERWILLLLLHLTH